MAHPWVSLIESQLSPLQPLTTDVSPQIPVLSGMRAVLFDIYGTLLISASGDVGDGTDSSTRAEAALAALRAVGGDPVGDGTAIVKSLHDAVHSIHQDARAAGVDHPEVDMRQIWQQVVRDPKLVTDLPAPAAEASWIERLAVEYEVRVNPVWPMPGVREALRAIKSAHRVLGIVSNAQFFTPWMWQAATGASLDEAGFDPLMRYFSCDHGRAKPGLALYQLAASALRQRSIEPWQTLYVGNDLRNDVAPAKAVGFRTVLFAGDRRSLRLRQDDAELQDVRPDATITEIKQLMTVLGI